MKRISGQEFIPKEYDEQVFIFEWAKLYETEYPELELLNSSLNGVRLTIGQAVKAKKGGMKKGYPDIFLPVKRGENSGLYIELKRIKDSYPTPEQRTWLNRLSEQGFYCCVCKGGQSAIDVIIKYLKGGL